MYFFLRIGHDNSGSNPGWHLKEVKIEAPNREIYYFPCKKWFDLNEDDGKLERSLYSEEFNNNRIENNNNCKI